MARRGQGGVSKKVKVVDLTLEGDEEDNATAGNLPGNGKHPLLRQPVMEVLFKQILLLKPQEDGKTGLSQLADLRVVCKTWNEEITKKIRKETFINVNRLIEPYPEGLGWAPVVAIGGSLHNNMLYQYSAPLPSEKIGSFENLDFSLESCADLSSPVLKWFQIMGSGVKRLRLTCSLVCYHQTRFIERILKEWCPNLESLTLRGVHCFDSLLQTSHFADPTPDNLPISLKEFVIDAEEIDCDRWSSGCGRNIEDFAEDQPIDDLSGRQEICAALSDFVDDLICYVDQAGERRTTTAKKENVLLSEMVKRPIGLTSLDEVSPLEFGSHVPELFQEKFSSDPGYENDGGLIGQLMRIAAIEKLVVQKAKSTDDHIRFFDEMFIMIFYRPNLWRESLQWFECEGNFSPITSVYSYNGGRRECRPPMVIFSKVGFQLKTLKFNMVSVEWSASASSLEPRCLQWILNSLAESLKELELAISYRNSSVSVITLPKMPKLKVLVVNCEKGSRLVRVTCGQVIGRLPMLERCVLWLGEIGDGAVSNFFKGKPKQGEDDVGRRHPLKELRLLDEHLDAKDVEMMTTWFPNLEKAELSIVRESVEDFKAFWEKIGGRLLRLERLKVNFATRLRSHLEYGIYEKVIEDNIEKFEGLKSLELEHEAIHTFPLTASFSKQFAKATKLRFLKFSNFQTTFYGKVSGKEEQEIKDGLPDVFVDLPAIAVRSRSSARMTRERSTRK